MSTQTAKGRLAWEDRFTIPASAALIAGLPPHLSVIAEHARAKLATVESVREEVAWQGVWRWTFTFVASIDGVRPWAYLVPDPTKLRLSIPVPASMMTDMPVKKLPKFVRDGLLHAPLVGQIKWPMWELQGKGQVDDILELSRFKLSMLTPKQAMV